MADPTRLCDLAIEVLVPIILFLTNQEIEFLQQTGDSHLLFKLRNGAVTSLEIEKEPPTFAAKFKKLTRYVSSRKYGHDPKEFQVELSGLPDTLTDLTWRRPVPHFGHFLRFQQLKHFKFDSFCPIDPTQQPQLLYLPIVSLTTGDLDQRVLQLVPPTLTALKFSIAAQQPVDWNLDPQYGATLDKYPHLRVLSIAGKPPSLNLIPPTVTDLSLEFTEVQPNWDAKEYDWALLPRELVHLKIHSNKLPLKVSNWTSLPPTLLTFDTYLLGMLTRELTDALPRSLTAFTAYRSPLVWKIRSEPKSEKRIFPGLPEGLTSLRIDIIPHQSTLPVELASELPRGLKELVLGTEYRSVSSFDDLPHQLRTLIVTMNPKDFHLLPHTLKSLTASLEIPNLPPRAHPDFPKFLAVDALSPLPPHLTHLEIISPMLFDTGAWLPQTLQTLLLHSRGGREEFPRADWFADLPASLTVLDVQASAPLKSAHVQHLAHLKALRSFKISGKTPRSEEDVDGIVFASLPRLLTELSIYCSENISEDDLAMLPRTLTELDLGFCMNKRAKFSASAIEKFPPRLKQVRLAVETGDPDAFRDQFVKSGRGMIFPVYGIDEPAPTISL